MKWVLILKKKNIYHITLDIALYEITKKNQKEKLFFTRKFHFPKNGPDKDHEAKSPKLHVN